MYEAPRAGFCPRSDSDDDSGRNKESGSMTGLLEKVSHVMHLGRTDGKLLYRCRKLDVWQ